jgi:hypothetical protein
MSDLIRVGRDDERCTGRGLTHEKAPSLGLPFRYFATGLAFLGLFSLLPFNAGAVSGQLPDSGLLALVPS